MAMKWEEVRNRILEEARNIWFEEPDEIKMIIKGIYPSGAGVGDIVFGNHFNVVQEMQTISYGTVEPTMYALLKDDNFSLDQCKTLFKLMMQKHAELTGGTYESYCPYPWMDLVKFREFYFDVVDAYDTIETKEQFRSLVWVFCGCYCARLCFYLQNALPWDATTKRFTATDLEEASRLINGMR